MTTSTMRRVLALLLALAFVTAACGGGDDDTDAGSGDDEGSEATGAPEQAEITLGLIPIVDVAPVFIGIEEGLFEAEGLTVNTEFAAGGAAAIPAVVSGEIDLAFGAYPSAFSAINEGLPLKIATEAVRPAPLFSGMYSLPDSGIETPGDMAGTTVAVNTRNNLVQIMVQYHLEQAGLGLDDVTLVEIGFPDMVAALELGEVDVITVVEPFGSAAVNNLDAHRVVDTFTADLENLPIAGFYVTEEWAAANPNTLAAFNRAFTKATEMAQDPENVYAVVPGYTGQTDEETRALNFPEFVSGVDTDAVQQVADFMEAQGLLSEPFTVADHLAG